MTALLSFPAPSSACLGPGPQALVSEAFCFGASDSWLPSATGTPSVGVVMPALPYLSHLLCQTREVQVELKLLGDRTVAAVKSSQGTGSPAFPKL